MRTCVPTKHVTIYPNQKQWFDGSIRSKLLAYQSGDDDSRKKANSHVRKAIQAAKRNYRDKLSDTLASKDPKETWQGVQRFANYKSKSSDKVPNDITLANELNQFYGRFDTEAAQVDCASVRTGASPLVVPTEDTKRVFHG